MKQVAKRAPQAIIALRYSGFRIAAAIVNLSLPLSSLGRSLACPSQRTAFEDESISHRLFSALGLDNRILLRMRRKRSLVIFGLPLYLIFTESVVLNVP